MRCHEICNSNRKRGRRRERLRQRQLTHAAADKLRLQLESPCSAVYLHAGTRSHMTLAHSNTRANTHIHAHMLSSTGGIASAAAATGVWHQGSLLNCLLATLWISIQLFAQLNQRTQSSLSLHLCLEAIFAARHGKKNLMPKKFIDS